MTDLGTLGGTSSFGAGSSNAGQIAGDSLTSQGSPDAFLYSGGVMIDLGTLGGAFSLVTAATYIAATGSADTQAGNEHAFLYTNGWGMVGLGTLGGANSEGNAINGNWQLTGWLLPAVARLTRSCTPRHAAAPLRIDGVIIDLGTLGGTYSEGDSINDMGQVVRYSNTNGNACRRAFLFLKRHNLRPEQPGNHRPERRGLLDRRTRDQQYWLDCGQRQRRSGLPAAAGSRAGVMGADALRRGDDRHSGAAQETVPDCGHFARGCRRLAPQVGKRGRSEAQGRTL